MSNHDEPVIQNRGGVVRAEVAWSGPKTLEQEWEEMKASGNVQEAIKPDVPISEDEKHRRVWASASESELPGFASQAELDAAMAEKADPDDIHTLYETDSKFRAMVDVRASRSTFDKQAPRVDHVSGLEVTPENAEAILKANQERMTEDLDRRDGIADSGRNRPPVPDESGH